MNNLWKIILVSLLAIVLVLLLIAPIFIKQYVINNSEELLGRSIEMEKLKLNYFKGVITIKDFKMYEADKTSEFISFDKLTVDLKPSRLFSDEFVMESLYLEGLKTNIIQYDSLFNFDDLIAFHSSDDDSLSQDATKSEPFHFHLSNIEIKDAELIYDDKSIDKTTDLVDISFFIPYIGWNQRYRSEAGLKFSFKDEGYFESSIYVDPADGKYKAEIKVHHLDLNGFTEYIAKYAEVNTLDGLMNTQILINGNISEIEKSLVSGYVEVLDLIMEDKENEKFLGIERMDCILKEIDVANMSFIIDSVILTKPYVYFELDTVSNNYFEIFNVASDSVTIAEANDKTEIKNDASTSESSDTIYYAVNFFSINEGIADYKDNLTGEPFDYYLSDIKLDANGIKSTSPWVKLHSRMLLNKRGKLNAKVGFNPSNPMDMEMDYVISDFQLADLNIYSRYYMGFPIIHGDMYYKSLTKIKDGQLASENKLVIRDVELGNKSKGMYELPMKLAFFLLKDREGVINLDVPVKGDLSDPEVSIGKIVWNTFKNLIIKVAASPFDLVTGILGVEPGSVKPIEFDYLDTTLTEERKNQFDLLLEVRDKKEGLGIELVYINDREKEKEEVAIEEVAQMFHAATNLDYKLNEKEFEQYVMKEIKTDTLKLPEACMKLSNTRVLDSLVNIYDTHRYNALQTFMQSLDDSSQMKISFADPDSPENSGSKPMFIMKYFILEVVK